MTGLRTGDRRPDTKKSDSERLRVEDRLDVMEKAARPGRLIEDCLIWADRNVPLPG